MERLKGWQLGAEPASGEVKGREGKKTREESDQETGREEEENGMEAVSAARFPRSGPVLSSAPTGARPSAGPSQYRQTRPL